MNYRIEYTAKAYKTAKKWAKSDPRNAQKLRLLLKAIAENPRIGLGHPEPLVGGQGIKWSRRITKFDRIIYEIHDDVITVIVIELQGHYSDK